MISLLALILAQDSDPRASLWVTIPTTRPQTQQDELEGEKVWLECTAGTHQKTKLTIEDAFFVIAQQVEDFGKGLPPARNEHLLYRQLLSFRSYGEVLWM